MTNLEISLLRIVIKNLRESTTTSWTKGNIDDFKKWNIDMMKTIKTSTEIIEEILNDQENNDSEKNIKL